MAKQKRSRWVAITTGAISVAIGILYLALITVLDARGPMLPPPPEALGVVEAAPVSSAAAVPQPAAAPPQETAVSYTHLTLPTSV